MWISVQWVFEAVDEALASYPRERVSAGFSLATPAEQTQESALLVRQSDVLVSSQRAPILAARAAEGHPRVLEFLLGDLTRGISGVFSPDYVSKLRECDTLVATSSAEAAVADKIFANADLAVVPLPLHPSLKVLDPATRARLRAEAGVSDRKVILYAGRITLEKNVHSVIQACAPLLRRGDTTLWIVGRMGNSGIVPEFGLHVCDMPATIQHVIRSANVPPDSVRIFSTVAQSDMVNFYNAADAFINLTIHHDENFGLAQVEAMACGLPVVVTGWGGLKDTVQDGVTGFAVTASATPFGTRVDRWTPAHRLRQLLDDPSLAARMGARGAEFARTEYDVRRFHDRIVALVDRLAARGSAENSAPLRMTDFGRSLWESAELASAEEGRGLARWTSGYRRSDSLMALYAELLDPFSSRLAPTVVPQEPVLSEDVHVQPWRVAAQPAADGHGTAVEVADPIWPFTFPVPPEFDACVAALLETLGTGEGALAGAEQDRCPTPEVHEAAVRWAEEHGILMRLRTAVEHDRVWISGLVGQKRADIGLRTAVVPESADVIYVRPEAGPASS